MTRPNPSLSQLAVRIKVKNRTSSGFIYIPDEESEFLYVITAKHCIYGNTFRNKPKNTDIQIFFSDGNEPAEFEEYRVQNSDIIIVDNPNVPDLAAVQIAKRNLNIDLNFRPALLATYDAKEAKTIFKGYPFYAGGGQPRTINGTLVPTDSNASLIRIATNSSFNNEHTAAEFNVKGYSGSGLCVEIDDTYYLIGIVFEYEKAGSRFHCYGVSDWLTRKLPAAVIYKTESERFMPLIKFRQNLYDAIKVLGPRYSEEFTFKTPLFDIFEALSASKGARARFFKEVNNVFENFDLIQIGYQDLIPKVKQDVKDFVLDPKVIRYIDKKITFDSQLLKVQNLLFDLATLGQEDEFVTIDFKSIQQLSRKIYEASYALHLAVSLIFDSASELKSDECLLRIKGFFSICEIYLGYVFSKDFEVLTSKYLLIDGEAGSGKSHLLADVANERNRDGRATFLFLGQNFLKIENPWETILTSLQLAYNKPEEVLNLLNEKGKLLGERVLIMIDAINEGIGLAIWKTYLESFVESFELFPYVGLVLSCRTTYLPLLFPTGSSKFITITHYGFYGFELEAFRAFAEHYKLKRKTVPVLTNEFGNPLFLKLLCIGVKNDPNYSVGKQISIERVFHYYISHVNEILSVQYDYDYIRLNLVQKAIDQFAAELVKRYTDALCYEDSYKVIENAVSQFVAKRRFLDNLIKENILVDSLTIKYINISFFIQFAYQRLGDHMVARHLLFQLEPDFSKGFLVGGLIHDFFSKYSNQRGLEGILDAIAIQLPEVYGKEILEVMPDNLKQSKRFYEAFLNSLAWRSKSIEVEKLDALLDRFFQDKEENSLLEYFWETNIALSLDDTNTFNGDYLHRVLKNLSLTDRDATWTIYLQDRFPENEYQTNSINRLLKWAWKSGPRDAYPDKVVLLGAKTIGWFFTSANRGLRDVSTKALIYLFKHHSELIVAWMREFEDINDPYVTQRVYAVAVGVAFRIENKERLEVLVDYVCTGFFASKETLPDILTRDYARIIVEYYSSKYPEFSNDLTSIRPPYISNFPTEFPSNEQIERYKEAEMRSVDMILESMVTEYGRGIAQYGDFGRYVFQRGLDDWKDIDLNLLSNLSVQWIFEKYGYDPQRFDAFDRDPGGVNSRIRSVHKERIGKKYQWLAFYEMMARVADNKPFHPYDWSKRKPAKQFQGPWQPFIRDIDPTFIDNPYRDRRPFWFQHFKYTAFDRKIRDWLNDHSDLPDPISLINIKDFDHEEWLILEMYPDLMERDETENTMSFREEKRRLWLQLRSYITHSRNYEGLTENLVNANFTGRWMPESDHKYELFNREYYWSPASHDLIDKSKVWQTIEYKKRNLGKVVPTSIQYLWEAEFDNSKMDGAVSFFKPSPFLYDLLHMKDGQNDGEFIDSGGKVVCFDPSINYDAPSCLLVRKKTIMECLKARKLKIFWTILGEKQVLNSDEPSMTFSALIKTSREGMSSKYNFFER